LYRILFIAKVLKITLFHYWFLTLVILSTNPLHSLERKQRNHTFLELRHCSFFLTFLLFFFKKRKNIHYYIVIANWWCRRVFFCFFFFFNFSNWIQNLPILFKTLTMQTLAPYNCIVVKLKNPIFSGLFLNNMLSLANIQK
jgi:hypothetical protein